MKNIEVMQEFLKRRNAHTTNLHTEREGNKFILVNYDEPIAYIEDNDLWLNKCRYSRTTSKIQGQLAFEATYTNYNIIEYNQGKVNKKGGY